MLNVTISRETQIDTNELTPQTQKNRASENRPYQVLAQRCLELRHSWWQCKWHIHFGKAWQFHLKLNIQLSNKPLILLDFVPKRNASIYPHRDCTQVVRVTALEDPKLQIPKCPWKGEYSAGVTPTQRICSATKRSELLISTTWMHFKITTLSGRSQPLHQ